MHPIVRLTKNNGGQFPAPKTLWTKNNGGQFPGPKILRTKNNGGQFPGRRPPYYRSEV